MAWTTPRDWTAGELVTEAIMDTHVRDNFLAVGPHFIARKTADQSVTSSTVLVNDTHLLLAVGASEVWLAHQVIWWSADTAADLKWSFTWPAGGTAIAMTVYPFAAGGGAASVQHVISSGTAQTLETQNATLNLTTFDVMITNGGTPGNLQFQWAQQTSNGTPTIVKTNSTLWAVKIA